MVFDQLNTLPLIKSTSRVTNHGHQYLTSDMTRLQKSIKLKHPLNLKIKPAPQDKELADALMYCFYKINIFKKVIV